MSVYSFIYSVCVLIAFGLNGWTLFKPVSQNPLQSFRQYGGRVVTILIDGVIEKTPGYQFAVSIKKTLEARNNYLRIIIMNDKSRGSDSYKHITEINRSHANLYLNLQLLTTTKKQSHVYVYYALYRATDTWSDTIKNIYFLPIDMSHKITIKKTIAYGNFLCQELEKNKPENSLCSGPFGVPLQTLVGINIPALVIEIGLALKDDYLTFATSMVESLEQIINLISIDNAKNDEHTNKTLSYTLSD